MKNPGFSSIEFLLYFCIMTVLTVVTTTAVMYAYSRNMEELRRVYYSAMLYGAHDVLAQDIFQACAASTDWYQKDEHALIVKTAAHNIGWELKKSKLIRSAGSYKGVIATGITACTFHITYEGKRVRALTTTLVAHGQTVTRRVALRNGRTV